MRNGYTVTIQRLTWDHRVPDAHDIAADDVDPLARYVVRQYDRIVRSAPVTRWDAARLAYELTQLGATYDPDAPSWLEYLLLAELMHTAHVSAQTETLPLEQSSARNVAA